MKVQKKLVEYITASGYKQSAIADACGIDQSAMSRVMNMERRLTLDEYCVVCKFLGKSMDFFVE